MSKPDFIPTTFKPDKNKAIKKLQHLGYNSKKSPSDFKERLHQAFYTPFLPNRVEWKPHQSEDVPYDELVPPVFIKNRILFYIHGGSFVAGSAECWRPFCASLANACSARAFVPEYRLAPSFAFPSPIEDIQRVFKEVYAYETASARIASHEPPELIIGADGSGASPMFAFIFNLKEHIRSSIKQIVLFSPWLDMTYEALAFSQKKSADKILSGEKIRAGADLYTYAANMKNPLVSPVFGTQENFRNFPPVYIQMGEHEILLADAQKFRAKLESLRIECELDIEPGMMHMFQMADEFLEESHIAVERVGKAVKARCKREDDD